MGPREPVDMSRCTKRFDSRFGLPWSVPRSSSGQGLHSLHPVPTEAESSFERFHRGIILSIRGSKQVKTHQLASTLHFGRRSLWIPLDPRVLAWRRSNAMAWQRSNSVEGKDTRSRCSRAWTIQRSPIFPSSLSVVIVSPVLLLLWQLARTTFHHQSTIFRLKVTIHNVTMSRQCLYVQIEMLPEAEVERGSLP